MVALAQVAPGPNAEVEMARYLHDVAGYAHAAPLAGSVATNEGQARVRVSGGVFAPEVEIEALRALRAAFPAMPLRIDPNGGWSVETTRRVMPLLAADGLLEYLEDPVPTLQDMGEVAGFASMPLATNMVTVAFGHIPETVRLQAVQVILSDHHYWGGLRATQQLAAIGRTFGLGISMHSNSHLGISLMAMTHVAASIPNLTYACDTHYPWQEEEVIQGGRVIGVISLQNLDREQAFSEADVRLLQTLSNSMSVALENARLFDQTQRLLAETEQRNSELAILNSVQSGLVAKLMGFFKPGGLSLKAWAYAPIESLGLAPVNASLLFALCFVAVMYGIAHVMWAKKWFVKV